MSYMEVPQMFLLAHAVQMAAEAEAAEATATGGANERPIVSRSVKGKWTESAETKGRRGGEGGGWQSPWSSE